MYLQGIDELLTYHYLVSETFRSADLPYERFWSMNKTEQADLVWQKLFVENTPLSEATSGIVSVLNAFGLDPRSADLEEARAFFASQDRRGHCDRVMQTAGVSDLVMTNDPFNDEEVRLWTASANDDRDPRLHASLRLDGLLKDWPRVLHALSRQGVQIEPELNDLTVSALRGFLDEWIAQGVLGLALVEIGAFDDEAILADFILSHCWEAEKSQQRAGRPRLPMHKRLRS